MSDNEMEVDKAAAGEAGEAGPSSKGGRSSGKGGKRFEIKKWSAVAMWSWAVRRAPAGEGGGALAQHLGARWPAVWPCRRAAGRRMLCATHADTRAAPPRPTPCADLHRHVRHLPQQPVRAQHRVPGQPHGRPRPPWPVHRVGLLRPRVPPGLHSGARRVRVCMLAHMRNMHEHARRWCGSRAARRGWRDACTAARLVQAVAHMPARAAQCKLRCPSDPAALAQDAVRVPTVQQGASCRLTACGSSGLRSAAARMHRTCWRRLWHSRHDAAPRLRAAAPSIFSPCSPRSGNSPRLRRSWQATL